LQSEKIFATLPVMEAIVPKGISYGGYLRWLREVAGITQGALAERLGVKQKWLCLRELGTKDLSDAEYLRAMGMLFQMIDERADAIIKERRRLSA
jgi:transcriptional regulator with XRE-family HTH domain